MSSDTNPDTDTDTDAERDRLEPQLTNDTADSDTDSESDKGRDASDGGSSFSLPSIPVSQGMLAAVLSVVFFLLVTATVFIMAPFRWMVAYVALIVGFLPGVLLFPWVTSPFGPGLWLLSEPFARIHFTISQFIRKAGVLVKRASNNYEIGTYLPDDQEVLLSDTRIEINDDRTSWGLFGKRKFGLTWEEGTDLHERIMPSEGAAVADGGEDGLVVNINAAHRYMEGSNEADAISRTEEKAEAQYGGGGEELSGLTMALLIAFMLVLGSMTTYVML